MENMYKGLGTVIGFSIIVFLVQTFVSEKAGQYTVLFTLLTMLILNSETFIAIVNSYKKEG